MTVRRWWMLSLLLGVVVFALNNLGVLSAVLATPDGFVHLLRPNATDTAIYDGWLRSSQHRLLHPNFQGPWLTEGAVFQPLLTVVALFARLTGWSLDVSNLLFHFATHLLTAGAVVFAVARFLPTTRERRLVVGVALLIVPMPALLVIPSLLLPLQSFGLPPLPGIGYFVWLTSDGFLHGISGSILVTWGTAFTVAAFALLAAYLQTGERRYLVGTCGAALICGLVHPYEPFLIMSAGGVALLLHHRPDWRRAIPSVVALGAAGSLGIAPTALLALTTPWVRDAAAITRWSPPNPLELFVALGLPTLVATVLLVFRRRMASAGDLVLQCWVGGTLIGLYLPFIPWTQHLLDGFHVGVALLLVRQLTLLSLPHIRWTRYRAPVVGMLSVLMLLSVGAAATFYRQAWRDGRSPTPARLFTSLVRADDATVRDWLAAHGAHTDLALAPLDRATWFSSVPMLSVAGNVLFSITYEEQSQLSNDFFQARMTPGRAAEFLDGYGVHWIVMPHDGPMHLLPSMARRRFAAGRWIVFELAGNQAKLYPGHAQ